jgi:hypothetical protein
MVVVVRIIIIKHRVCVVLGHVHLLLLLRGLLVLIHSCKPAVVGSTGRHSWDVGVVVFVVEGDLIECIRDIGGGIVKNGGWGVIAWVVVVVVVGSIVVVVGSKDAVVIRAIICVVDFFVVNENGIAIAIEEFEAATVSTR